MQGNGKAPKTKQRSVSKLHMTLGILMFGFVIEGGLETYTYLSRSYELPYSGLVFVLGPFITFAGIAFLWVGRHEWTETLSRRLRHAHISFWLSILALILAIAPVLWYGSHTAASVDAWVEWEFGAAIMMSFLLAFVTYVLVIFELTGPIGKSVLLLALAWAALVTYWIAHALTGELMNIMQMVQTRTLNMTHINEPIASFESYLAVTYVLLLAVYVRPYLRILSGSKDHLRPEFRD